MRCVMCCQRQVKMKFDTKDPYERIKLLQEKIMRQRSALKSQRITILELQARLRKPEVQIAVVAPKDEMLDDLVASGEISARVCNALQAEWHRWGRDEVRVLDLIEERQIDLMRLRHFGRGCLREVATVLKKRGLWFKAGGEQFIKVDDIH